MHEVFVDAVSKTRGTDNVVLREVTFSASRGSFTSVLGPSGCGKSTLLRLIAGLEQPSQGIVWVRGRNLVDQSVGDSEVGLVFPDYALFPHLSVFNNVAFGLRNQSIATTQLYSRVSAMLELLGLESLSSRLPGSLSGGEQQRVALARALVLELPILLLDEPLANLDAHLRRQLRDEIRGLQRRLGITVIYVTHDFVEAMAVSDQIVLMNQGKVVQIGSPRDLYEAPATTFAASFIGDMALFEVSVGDGGCVSLGRLNLSIPGTAPAPCAQLLVRPEAWRIEPAKQGGIHGKVLRSAYLGHLVEYYLETDIGEIFATSSHVRALMQPGTPVSVSLRDSGYHLIPTPVPTEIT